MKRVYDINSNVYCKSLTPGLVIQYHTGIVQAVRTEFRYLCPLDSYPYGEDLFPYLELMG